MRIILLVSAVAFLLLGLTWMRSAPPVLEVQNASSRTIESIEVRVGEEKEQIQSLSPGQHGRQALPLHGEGPIELRLRFAGGRVSDLSAGFFAPGMVGETRVRVIGPDSLEIQAR